MEVEKTGNINEYKIENPKERAMLIACDYVGSYGTSYRESIEEARENFFEKIIQIAKEKNHNIITFSFFSTDYIDDEQIKKVTEILQREKIQEMMKKLNVKIILGNQYRKKNSSNITKSEDISDELEDLSYKYYITDLIVLDDTDKMNNKMFILHWSILERFPDINIDYISLTSSFPELLNYRGKLNIYGKFTDEEFKALTEEDDEKFSGLGELGYMSSGVLRLLEKEKGKKCIQSKSIDQK